MEETGHPETPVALRAWTMIQVPFHASCSHFPGCSRCVIPPRLCALRHGLTREMQAMTPGTVFFFFLEENSKLTVFSEGQASLLCCQCLKQV